MLKYWSLMINIAKAKEEREVGETRVVAFKERFPPLNLLVNQQIGL